MVEIGRKRLDGAAITDHDNIEGALAICKLILEMDPEYQPIIIPGIEVSTKKGHIIALNVKETIPRGLSVKETIDRIHEVGGIAIAAHPQTFFKDGIGLSPKILSLGLDAIEVINSSLFPFKPMVKACKEFAERYGLPQTAGSDSHIRETIGLSYTLIDVEEKNIDSIIKSIKRGLTTPIGTGIPFVLRIKSIFRRSSEKNINFQWLESSATRGHSR